MVGGRHCGARRRRSRRFGSAFFDAKNGMRGAPITRNRAVAARGGRTPMPAIQSSQSAPARVRADAPCPRVRVWQMSWSGAAL
jgi:hypothetical protein